MGKLLYGPQQRALEIDDRLLAHLKIVILTKLRRGESFAFSWENEVAEGGGRGTIWLNPGIPIEFTFYGGRRPAINRAWLQALTATVERGELHAMPEIEETGSASPSNQARW
ncbi:ATP-dependent DNA ligase [Herbiconiux sp. 11R-BC]|uniref:DUF7882 family protein n=1 Tax=Herbiconiux sp. 11R-BC TaxID=3111637 RepID=UPI003BFCABD5